jgi:hypothetical protein
VDFEVAVEEPEGYPARVPLSSGGSRLSVGQSLSLSDQQQTESLFQALSFVFDLSSSDRLSLFKAGVAQGLSESVV